MKKIIFILAFFLSSCSPPDNTKRQDGTTNTSIEVSGEIKRISIGNKNAKITIIAYESLTCGYCANFHTNIYPQLKKEYIDTNKVIIEFRNFPLDAAALNASIIAHCKNDGSSEILNFLYSEQGKWAQGKNISEVNSNIENVLLDGNYQLDFKKCLNNKKLEDYVLEDRIKGVKKFNIEATPTLIINGEKFEKSLTYKNIKKKLEKML